MLLRRVTEHVKAQNWTAVALDFLIVVVGVYSAVWVEGAQERNEERERTALVIETLRNDLRGSTVIEQEFNAAMESGLAQWEADFDAGLMPAPYYFRVPGSDTAPEKVWDALLNMKLGELLHPELVFELAFFYSEREGVGRKYIRYVSFVESEILPGLNEDPSVFYVADGSQLKPAFAASMARLRDWKMAARVNIGWAICLDRRLDTPNASGGSCSPFEAYGDASRASPNEAVKK